MQSCPCSYSCPRPCPRPRPRGRRRTRTRKSTPHPDHRRSNGSMRSTPFVARCSACVHVGSMGGSWPGSSRCGLSAARARTVAQTTDGSRSRRSRWWSRWWSPRRLVPPRWAQRTALRLKRRREPAGRAVSAACRSGRRRESTNGAVFARCCTRRGGPTRRARTAAVGASRGESTRIAVCAFRGSFGDVVGGHARIACQAITVLGRGRVLSQFTFLAHLRFPPPGMTIPELKNFCLVLRKVLGSRC